MAENRSTSMQRDQRVLRHSALGAFWGWLSTAIIYIVFATLQWIDWILFNRENFHSNSILGWHLPLYMLGGSFFVTLAGWLFVGIPIAALIKDRQARSFKFMVTIHTIATVFVVIGPSLIALLLPPWEINFGELLRGLLFNFLTIWAAAIGFIGGSIFCALERRH